MLTVPIILIFLNLAVDARTDSNENFRTVLTSTGRVIGTFKYYRDEKNKLIQFVEYLGIPYATPPVGGLRFKPPEPPKRWEVLNATQTKPPCAQISCVPHEKKKMLIGDEDCLYLNIYVPQILNNTELMPVLIWIHGGSFQHGTGTDVKGKYLMEHEIVFVTFNYRLGPFGFLSTEDHIVPGNMGLKDQSMALRWVSKNIMSFQGDPSRITLIGLDAGGASVHYHYLSDLSRRLFHGGISMSGTALHPWALTKYPRDKTRQLAKKMNCNTHETKNMIKCLRNSATCDILKNADELMPFNISSGVLFGPVVEPSSVNSFIAMRPIDIITNGLVQDIPWITGVTETNGLYFVSELVTSGFVKTQKFEKMWDYYFPHIFYYDEIYGHKLRSFVSRKLRDKYFGLVSVGNERMFIQTANDLLFKIDSERAARRQAEVNQEPVWYYYYTYQCRQIRCNTIYNIPEIYGACHSDNAYYIIENDLFNPKISSRNEEMQLKLIELWVSFIKTQVPSSSDVIWKNINPYYCEFDYLVFKNVSQINMHTSTDFGIINSENKYNVCPK